MSQRGQSRRSASCLPDLLTIWVDVSRILTELTGPLRFIYFSNSLSKSRKEQLQGLRKSSTQSSAVGVR